MKSRFVILASLAPLALAGCTQERPSERPTVAPAAQVIGKAENCVSLTAFNSTRIRDDWTIDFEGVGDRVWRNTLPNRCPGLKSADKFTYKTSLSQLCSTDIIYVLNDYGGSLQRGAGCGLGPFVPVKLEK